MTDDGDADVGEKEDDTEDGTGGILERVCYVIGGRYIASRKKQQQTRRGSNPPSELPDGSGWGDHIQLLQIYKLWDQTDYSNMTGTRDAFCKKCEETTVSNNAEVCKRSRLAGASISIGAGEAAEEGRQSVWSPPPLISLRGSCVKRDSSKVEGMGERKCDGEVGDDMFIAYLNLNNLGRLNSFRAENAEDLNSPASGIKANGGDSSDNEATSSVIGSGTNNLQRSGVFHFLITEEGIKWTKCGWRTLLPHGLGTKEARMSLRSRCEGVAAINTIMSVMGINLKSLHSEPCYSSKAVHPIPLGKVMSIAQMMKNEFPNQHLSIFGIGGVEMGSDAAEFILLGFFHRRVPPPHLYPFVDAEAEGYVPELCRYHQKASSSCNLYSFQWLVAVISS
ncbi:dihydropyrimidine dehydrogenase (NADP(+)), chloroplastic [Tanacetum coccineum]